MVWQSLALRPGAVRYKLAVSQPDDPSEREADRIADHVMQMASPSPSASQVVNPQLKDKPSSAPSVSRKIQRKCDPCEEEEERKLQRKEQGCEDAVSTPSPIVHEALNAPGQPLDFRDTVLHGGAFRPRLWTCARACGWPRCSVSARR